MANDIEWIKLTVRMFDNRKIKHIRKLPEGNNIILIWIMLLTMAGRCNANGFIFITENIPYTPKMLADELGFDESVIQIALNALEKFDMIHRDNNFLSIPGWQEHQNADGMEKVREQTRNRVSEYRRKQKEQAEELECKKTERKKLPKPEKVYFSEDAELNQAFIDFAKMRKEIKKPLTERAELLAINKLKRLSMVNGAMDIDLAICILEQSIEHDWQSIYELKDTIELKRRRAQKQETEKEEELVGDDWKNLPVPERPEGYWDEV